MSPTATADSGTDTRALARQYSHPQRRTPRDGKLWWVHIVLAVGGFGMAFPFLWQIIMSLSMRSEVQSVPPTFWPASLQWHNYVDVFRLLPFFDQLRVSVLMTVIQVLVQIALCTFAGYAFARMRFHGRGFLFGVVLSILLVPPQVYLLSQYQIVQSLGWLNTIMGIVAPGLFSAFGTFLMRTAFLHLPRELEEAARLDGAGPFQVFARVMLPLVGPSISVLAITTIMFSWNLLLWPLVVSTQADQMPLAAGLATLAGNRQIDYPILMAASMMAMAPVLIMFIVLQRRVIEGIASTGLKG